MAKKKTYFLKGHKPGEVEIIGLGRIDTRKLTEEDAKKLTNKGIPLDFREENIPDAPPEAK